MDFYDNSGEISSDEFDLANCELEAAVSESLIRILPGAPFENRSVLFGMLCQTKAAEAAAFRQWKIDECWDAACVAGLPNLLGTTAVQGFIVREFCGDAS